MASLLIVDDDDDIAEVCADVLRSEGHEVRIARNGAQGLLLLDEQPVELILCDVEMPVLSGPDMACQILLLDAGKEKIPLVLASGAADLRSVARTVGTPYFMAKPFSVKQLLAIVNRALAERVAPTPQTQESRRQDVAS